MTAFLSETACLDRIQRAIRSNGRRWIIRWVRHSGGEIHHGNGVTWIYIPGDYATILSPQLTRAAADSELDRIIRYYRRRRPKRVSCGWFGRSQPFDLATRLERRGFKRVGQFPVMWLDLTGIRSRRSEPRGLRIETVRTMPEWEVEDLPFYSRGTAPVRHALSRIRPKRVWHFAASLDDRIVGHGTLSLTTGPLGIAGIRDIGVVPEARNKGIGRALTVRACRQAADLGCRYAALQPTDMAYHMYETVGFREICKNELWWLQMAPGGS